MWLCGSTAGYLLSKKGALKLSKLKLNYHIDIQIHNNKHLNIYKLKHLYYVYLIVVTFLNLIFTKK